MVTASSTQVESHLVLQQYESESHTSLTQALQVATSLLPVLHTSWLHVEVPATHWPAVLQVLPLVQVPQLPPQPSSPHDLPLQLGTQAATHCPAVLHDLPLAQVPQLPPQPSLPHTRPLQLGVQVPPVSSEALGVPLPVGPS